MEIWEISEIAGDATKKIHQWSSMGMQISKVVKDDARIPSQLSSNVWCFGVLGNKTISYDWLRESAMHLGHPTCSGQLDSSCFTFCGAFRLSDLSIPVLRPCPRIVWKKSWEWHLNAQLQWSNQQSLSHQPEKRETSLIIDYITFVHKQSLGTGCKNIQVSCSSPHPTIPPSSPCTHTVGTGQTNSFCNDRNQQIVGPPLHRLHPSTQSCSSRIGHLLSRWMPVAVCGAAACCASTSGKGRSESLPPPSAAGERGPHPPQALGEEPKVQGSPHPHPPLGRHPGGAFSWS